MRANKKLILACGAFLLLIALLSGVYLASRPQAAPGEKTVTVEVVHQDGTARTFTYRTDEEYLGELLLSEGLVKGEEGPYGLYIEEADGEAADYGADRSYWALYEGEEYAAQGVSETALSDGARFSLVYTVG